jgi:predicted transcriptional regulator
MARFTESLYREMEPVSEMGTVDPTLTYSEIADMIIDTICNYAGMGQIPATELPTLIKDALEQLAGYDDFESADEELL